MPASERHRRPSHARPVVEVEVTAGVSEHEDRGGVLFQPRIVLLDDDGQGDEALVGQEEGDGCRPQARAAILGHWPIDATSRLRYAVGWPRMSDAREYVNQFRAENEPKLRIGHRVREGL